VHVSAALNPEGRCPVANQKEEHGPHPMALLRDWKLDLNPTIQKQAKTELEYYKLADLLTCLLLHSPTLNAGKIRFTAAQSQLAKLQGVSEKTIYTRLKSLETMTVIEWEQPKAEGGVYQPAVFTVSRSSVSKKDAPGDPRKARVNDAPVSNKQGVPSVESDGTVSKKQEFTDGEVTDTGLKSSGHSGHVWLEEQDDTTDASLEDQDQEQRPVDPISPWAPVHPVLNTPVSAAPRKPAKSAHGPWVTYDNKPCPTTPAAGYCAECGVAYQMRDQMSCRANPASSTRDARVKAAAVSMEPGDEVEMPKSTAFRFED
jgi:hypothetical protein